MVAFIPAEKALIGLEIWCVENLHLVPVPKSSHGKFFCGSAYIVLHTVSLRSGSFEHDIHYWLGNDAKEVDSALVSDKALELDDALGSHAVQYREVQGEETEKFLSYFKPCIIPIEGTFSSGPENLNSETYQVSLLTCKGDRVVYVKEVPFTRTSLNHNDVFILDTASKIFLFSGCNSSIQGRAKALEVVQYIKENKHGGNCEVAAIDDGKLVGDPDVGEFWSLFGGYAPIPRDSPSATQKEPDLSTVKLFWITTQGKFSESETDNLKKEILSSNKCYMLDSDSEIFVWMGRTTSITERKTAIASVEEFVRSQGRSVSTHLTFLTEGSETASFRSYFDNWPQTVEPKLYEDGRGKVAAMFKQHGYDVKELPEEDCQPYIDCNGTLKVWRVDDNGVLLLPVEEQRKLYSGDCYIVQYVYSSNDREENLFYGWLGCSSTMESKAGAISHMNLIATSIKGNPVVAQITEGREPVQFFFIFQTLIIFKGGKSAQFKLSIADKGIPDETYDETRTALFRVQGKSLDNMQAIQVDLASTSLNSSYCYILKTETSVFTWAGNLSSARDHDLVDRMLDLIHPTWQPILVREGSEPDLFWHALGGKGEYPREKEIDIFIEDPHLFTCALTEGDFKVKEIFNFSQDDLTTEDVVVLDCRSEIYVWIGHHSNIGSKQEAISIGLKFLEMDILVEGLTLEIPIYVVTEGYEPPFFTRFFEWDPSKANMLGNSFERKLAILKGQAQKIEAPLRSAWKAYSIDTNPDSVRSQSVGPNERARSSSPASSILGSSSKSSDYRRFSSPPAITKKLFSGYSSDLVEAANGLSAPSGNKGMQRVHQPQECITYPYERLKVVSSDPVTGIDVTKREAYLSDEEFQETFKMTRGAFYDLPRWRQNKLKMSVHLF
ncbi:villin-1 isoform X2 [Diospyros lotus]|uniref:villin-1 isoform X2 n=1 Tax=Diospyros lotus TaxID=55363 RepID=UPI002253D1B0|nr:villin-1 isoform X2 [Diospyros lotus]XP_052185186.1 villin-1 isoform X2 [Diospyros lotus]XP_052185192.1 villin-1 isoform X2 [Diospyros lotus]